MKKNKKRRIPIMAIGMVLIVLNLKAQDTRGCLGVDFTLPLNYMVYQIDNSLTIDGKTNESVWAKAAWSADFVDIEGQIKPAPKLSTRFKALWDDQNLYIFAELEESHIWATLAGRDQIVYHDNDFEIFIEPDGDSYRYFEMEVSALGTLFDLFLDKPYRDGGEALVTWYLFYIP